MIEAQLKVKRWGNSLGVVLPRQLVQNQQLKEGSMVEIFIPEKMTKPVDLRKLFGSLKGKKIDAQKMKDESRKIWDM